MDPMDFEYTAARQSADASESAKRAATAVAMASDLLARACRPERKKDMITILKAAELLREAAEAAEDAAVAAKGAARIAQESPTEKCTEAKKFWGDASDAARAAEEAHAAVQTAIFGPDVAVVHERRKR